MNILYETSGGGQQGGLSGGQSAKKCSRIDKHISEYEIELKKITGLRDVSKLHDGKESKVVCTRDLKEQDFLCVDGLYHAGLKEREERSLLYLRSESHTHMKKLDKIQVGNNLLVDGPKGSGKSVITWTWARVKAASGKRVLWIYIY
mmetsp:Transcript_14690/g.20567  ORF Transcript_14690/g.20567 Transcript_14690/m.20567 type:complete len:147 (+) Transcript_14690:178-618(+)